MLSIEQKYKVSENHNLIYWYANLHGLDVEEWYGVLAIALCEAVADHDSAKGSLSNYFKVKADGAMSKEFSKLKTHKRKHNGMYELTDLNHPSTFPNMEADIIINDMLEDDETGILKLKLHGLTQNEISERLGVSQSTVSRVLSKTKGLYYDDGQDDC